KKIFIGTGTEPFIPPIPGIETLSEDQMLTNLNIFDQDEIPKRLTIIGGGAIGTEMAQAFSRLGSEVNIIQMDNFLLPMGDEEAGILLGKSLELEGIGIYNSTKIEKIEVKEGVVYTHTSKGVFEGDKILIATGRRPALETLKLEAAGIKYDKKGIIVDEHMRTNQKNIYAVGDCNGLALLSHAAMHQGMLALMNAMNPTPFKFKRSKYIVPWSVFTNPEVAQAGLTEKEAREKNYKIEVVKREFSSYGRTIADGKPEGFIKVITNKRGKIYGVTIVGTEASELIHEWILAIQKNLTMFDIMMTQHSFPTISMLNKMVAEDWMMKKMGNTWIKRLAKFFI
ncbi:MAG: NAD(P)/FAD-dependent oxidoreductase, partial [Psychrilyobacter sp.]|nr:NAD(P)/FAD-dependent oxidoreductase [Psychrilyobacter sp.]